MSLATESFSIGTDAGEGFTLHGGQMVQMRVDKSQPVYAKSTGSANVVVVRQD